MGRATAVQAGLPGREPDREDCRAAVRGDGANPWETVNRRGGTAGSGLVHEAPERTPPRRG